MLFISLYEIGIKLNLYIYLDQSKVNLKIGTTLHVFVNSELYFVIDSTPQSINQKNTLSFDCFYQKKKEGFNPCLDTTDIDPRLNVTIMIIPITNMSLFKH